MTRELGRVPSPDKVWDKLATVSVTEPGSLDKSTVETALCQVLTAAVFAHRMAEIGGDGLRDVASMVAMGEQQPRRE